jgi:hypothetical protein
MKVIFELQLELWDPDSDATTGDLESCRFQKFLGSFPSFFHSLRHSQGTKKYLEKALS